MERGESWVVEHGGHHYFTSAEMSQAFLNQADRAIASGEPTLVVLRHTKGVELLLITDASSFRVVSREAHARADRP
ncbi:hypothetical protein G3T36_09185 [Diaminobutyricibacter tongyongensis]|uniref:Uncharacterized protein n=1 Tax=Leifsonia tongyongensis TaxID=1268043 RepID=A0A6L9XYJ3_9MICO|nr:hypothetical protein [Diaminobutyricibacter tongyongensis]NEN06048.1 hypothetical protein [Diaminobutyricibacter tongyongensis]